MSALAFKEGLGEGTAEWLMNFDPVATEKRVATEGIPPCFQQRYDELQEWRAIMERRADFTNLQPDLGRPVLRPAEEFWASIKHP